MADPRSPGTDDANPLDQHDFPDRSIATPPPAPETISGPDGATNNNGDAPLSARSPTGNQLPPGPAHAVADGSSGLVDGVLKSQIGIATLLNRLKHSIASSREFAMFLKKRADLEDHNAQGLKKLCRSTQDNMRRPEHRGGSFTYAYDEMVHIHERMADNGSHFAASLHTMHDDLVDLAMTAERNRKTWKTNGLAAEHKVADLEQTMRKSKTKYDSLADEYERARTGEARQTGKVLNAFKNKSAAQHEEDLLKKVNAADQTYKGHVTTLQTEKAHLENSTRPDAVRSIQELIKELDSGLTLQMQKFAAFNEKLLLSNGLSISPIKPPGSAGGEPSSRSLRHAVMSIDNDRDLNDFVAQHVSKIPPHTGDIKYERHPVLGSSQPNFSQGPLSGSPSQGVGGPPPLSGFPGSGGAPAPSSMGARSNHGNFGSTASSQGPQTMGQSFSPTGHPPPSQPFAHQHQHSRSFSSGNPQQQFMSPTGPPPPLQTQSHGPGNGNGSGSGSSHGAPQLGALPFQSGQSPQHPQHPQHPQQPSAPFHPSSHERSGSGAGIPPGVRNSPPPQATQAPLNPVFGVDLGRLYERDGLAVPSAVYQCIQAVDLFGLGVEGIYRQSGSMAHIQKLKHMFDTESQSQALDFRNPENFFHDVNSVTGLLKQFCRELPDPLLTNEHHDALVEAAKNDDDIVRRDSLHAIINALPDPNYATLRAIALHLYRVIESAHINRMNSHNLAVIFGPTLMGTDPGRAIQDAGWQIKVVDTILQNTYQIFEED